VSARVETLNAASTNEVQHDLEQASASASETLLRVPRKQRSWLAISLAIALVMYAVFVLLLNSPAAQHALTPRGADTPARHDAAQAVQSAWMQEWTTRLSTVEIDVHTQGEQLAKMVGELQTLALQTRSHAEHQEQTDADVARVMGEVQQLTQAQDALKRRLIALSRRRAPPLEVSPPAAAASTSEVAAPPAPPFTLVSTDRWDGRPYVALSLAGAIDFVGPGDRIAGWQVQSIDVPARRAMFVDAQGRTYTAEVQR